MKGQKEFVVEMVLGIVPGFIKGRDVALMKLSHNELENVKAHTAVAIINGEVEYSKDRTREAEVVSYARSMVMNHLKKSKDLNGRQTYGKTVGEVESARSIKALSSINTSLLTEDLATFVKTLV